MGSLFVFPWFYGQDEMTTRQLEVRRIFTEAGVVYGVVFFTTVASDGYILWVVPNRIGFLTKKIK